MKLIKRLKPVYLLFLAIPIVYLLLWNNRQVGISSNSKLPDYFYFSVKTSQPATLKLLCGKDTLSKWNLNSSGYKNLQFVGKINDSTGLSLIVNNLNSHDTVSFSGINLYHNNHVSSIYRDLDKYCTIENAKTDGSNGTFNAIIQQSGKAASFHLKPSSNWEKDNIRLRFHLLILLIFSIGFILLFIFNPSPRYFISSLLITIAVMIIYYLNSSNSVNRVTMLSTSTMKGAEVYYSPTPFFSPASRYNSANDTKSYSVPLNLETDGYLRCDVFESSKEISDFKIKIITGIFGSTYDISAISQASLVANDLVLRGNKYYTTGNDPFFLFTSNYFTNKIKWLLLMERNVFLFVSLLVFLFLLCIHRFIKGVDKLLNKLRFKVAYLSFLLIPLTYLLITHYWQQEIPSKSPDQIYYSARTSKPAIISLINGTDSITSWQINSPAFKYFQYCGHLNDSAGYHLRVENLAANDTLSLLSVNLFHEDHAYSILNKKESVCTIKNAAFIDKVGEVVAVVKNSNEPVIINLLPNTALKKDNSKNEMESIVILVFILSFIIVLIFAPRSRYFIISCIIVSVLMLVFYWVCNAMQYQVVMSTSSPMKNAQIFYNNNPNFGADKRNDVNPKTPVFKSQIDLSVNNYLRFDIADNTKKLNELHICTKTGLLGNDWDYSTIPQEQILMNDMVKRGTSFSIPGDDPYFVLSAGQTRSIHWMSLWRQNIFFLITILFFLVLISANKFAEKQNLTAFFLSLIFLALISFGLLLRFFNSDSIILSAELRYANTSPAFRTDSSEVFINNLDNYLKDQISGRNNMIIANNLMEYSIFGELMNNKYVHFGRDGWMFYIGGLCRENYETRHPLTLQQLKKMTAVLTARRDWLRERDIQFYFMFPPMAYFVYEDEVGPRLRRYSKKSKVEQLYEYLKLHSDLNMIDVLNPLIDARKNGKDDLYFRNNSHWNYHGSFVAYQTLINYIRKDFPGMPKPIASKDLKWVDFDNYTTDLYKAIALDQYYTSHEYQPSIKDMLANVETTYPTYPGYSSAALAFCLTNKRLKSPSMLLYGDSYAGFLSYYLATNFSRSIYLWTPLFYPSIVEKEKPDIVIQEMNDYSIYNVLYPGPPLPAKKDTILK